MRYFHLRHPRRRGRRRAPARCGREAPASLSGNDHDSRGAPLAVAGRREVARGGFAGKNRESDAHPSSPWRPRRCFNLAPRKILPERRVPPKRDLVACELECYSRAPQRPSGRVACECGVRIACTYNVKHHFPVSGKWSRLRRR
ncbi:hypothetical protein EVAR_43245_1 [Eumeta japonica]|uniref:Uncharacterized protein n=1 Tax=Eumeta variegata TaxID=151549 RepID=A0A4C1WTN5_EUMVA|nr:hypothetical protein EVAR_43245_1 [Eumeta japonica]